VVSLHTVCACVHAGVNAVVCVIRVMCCVQEFGPTIPS